VWAVSLFKRGEQFGLVGSRGRVIGGVVAAERLPGDAGGDLEGAGDLAEGHFFHFLVAETFEEAQDGGEESLTGGPFLLPVIAGAAGPLLGLLEVEGGLGLGVGLKQAGNVGVQAVAPLEFAGPFFDGGRVLAEGIGDGGQGAGLAELEVGEEGGEGARGFAGTTGEGGGWKLGARSGERGGPEQESPTPKC